MGPHAGLFRVVRGSSVCMLRRGLWCQAGLSLAVRLAAQVAARRTSGAARRCREREVEARPGRGAWTSKHRLSGPAIWLTHRTAGRHAARQVAA